MVAYGIVDVISSLVTGHLGKYLNRNWHYMIAFLCIGVYILMTLLWIPSSNQLALLFVPPVLVAIGFAIFSTQNKGNPS